ncbi:MAG TPA: NAAT family transporter [Candidatus Deferrimicrobiaceae bacterium]
MLPWTVYLKIFTALLAIVDPIGSVPVFISLTDSQRKPERYRTAWVVAVTTSAVLIGACLFGDSLLRLFGVSIASFRVGGGILLLLMAVTMFHAERSRSRQTPEEAIEAGERSGVAVVPLAIPLLSGPGAISAMIIYSAQAEDPAHTALLVAGSLLLGLIVWISLRLAVPIGGLLGRTGINIVTRLMSLLLAAIAVEFIVGGLAEQLPGLVSPR